MPNNCFINLGTGIEEVKDFLIQNAKPGKWMFPKETWTDQSNQTIIEKAVKAVLLDTLPQELPYSMTVRMEYFKQELDGEYSNFCSSIYTTKNFSSNFV